MLKALFVSLAFAFLIGAALADERTWLGNASGTWLMGVSGLADKVSALTSCPVGLGFDGTDGCNFYASALQ